MKKLTVLTLTLVLIAAMALTPATAQQYVHTYTLTGHVNSVLEIAFGDNGTLISASYDNILYAWDVTTGTQRWQKDVGNSVFAVALPSHDPNFIAYGGRNDHNIRMRYSDDGDWRGQVDGHTERVESLAFKPNSYLLASGSRDRTIRIWDVRDRDNLRHVRTLRGHTDYVYSVAWSPDGRTLASASKDGTVRLWNPNNGINFAVLRGHTEGVHCVAWRPDGRILASGSFYDKTIRLWDPDTHGTLRVLRGQHTSHVQTLAFHPDGQTLAADGVEGVNLWDPNTGALKATIMLGGSLVTFSPNGQILAAKPRGGTTSINLYRLVTADVTGNGKVNVNDLVEVARNYGKTVGAGANRKADVNNDGKVDIDDLIAVAKAVDAAAAPSLAQEGPNLTVTATAVRQWIRDAKQTNADPAGIAALERLLAALIHVEAPPKETVLLANYPNPFNPETWIPYQLAEAAEIQVSIHAADGTLVRALELGQRPAGVYQSRSRAAYWDGRNALNEPVASGVYFYTLMAGDFKATRKMLIRK